MGTFPPPSPSTIFPLLTSTTLACRRAPSRESSKEPQMPISVTETANVILEWIAHPAFWDGGDVEQNGISRVAVTLMIEAPRRPACIPVVVTPPLVPGGTLRQGEVIRRGGEVERIPSSEEKVSAATAA